MSSKNVYETFYKDIYEECCKGVYDNIYNGLKKYKDDEVFRMEYPHVDKMIESLNKGTEIFEQNFYKKSSEKYNDLYKFIENFDCKREDIKWFYENKSNYIEELIRYENINFTIETYREKSIYEGVDKILCVYSMCKNSYQKAEENLNTLFKSNMEKNFKSENLQEDIVNIKELTVEYALKQLKKYIKDYYSDYEETARKNRNIREEVKETISILEEYSKDITFIKEVPNVFNIIEILKEGAKSNDEDKMYKAFFQVSYIRKSMNLYKTNPQYMKFFHENRNIVSLLKVKNEEIDKYPPYMQKLYYYIDTFDKSNTLCEFLGKTKLCLQLDYLSLDKLTRWVIEGINEWQL